MAKTLKPIIEKTTSNFGLPTWSITDAKPTLKFIKEELFDDILYHNMETTVCYGKLSILEMKILNKIKRNLAINVGNRRASLKITAGKVKDNLSHISQTFELQVTVLHNFTDSMDDENKKSELELTRFALNRSPALMDEVCSLFTDMLESVIAQFQHEYKLFLRSNRNLENALVLATEQRIKQSENELNSKNLLDSKFECLVHQIADVVEEIRSFNNTSILRTIELNSDEIPSHFRELIEVQLKRKQEPIDHNSMVKAINALV